MQENGLKTRFRLKENLTFANLMNQQKAISPRILVFSKWSRKKYAIFASLGKLIKIGVLNADICQKSLLKGLVNIAYNANIKSDIDADENELKIKDHDSLQFILSFLGLSIFQVFNFASITNSKKVNPFRTKLYSEYKVCFLPGVRNRLFFTTQLEFHKL